MNRALRAGFLVSIYEDKVATDTLGATDESTINIECISVNFINKSAVNLHGWSRVAGSWFSYQVARFPREENQQSATTYRDASCLRAWKT
jgi:hypothetical protein